MVPLRVFCFAAAMLHAAAAPWAAMSCLRPPYRRIVQRDARCCHAAIGPPDYAPNSDLHFTRDCQIAPLPIGKNSPETPYIVGFAQTTWQSPASREGCRNALPAAWTMVRHAALSGRHCLRPPAIEYPLRHSKCAAEISTICGTTATSLLLQTRSAAARSAGVSTTLQLENFNVRHSR